MQLGQPAPAPAHRRRTLLLSRRRAALQASAAVVPVSVSLGTASGVGARAAAAASSIQSAAAGGGGGSGGALLAALQQAGIPDPQLSVSAPPALDIACAATVAVSGGSRPLAVADSLSSALQPGGLLASALSSLIGNAVLSAGAIVLPPPPPPRPRASPSPPQPPLPPFAPVENKGCDLKPCAANVVW